MSYYQDPRNNREYPPVYNGGNQQPYNAYGRTLSVEDKVTKAMKNVYLLMCIALVVSGITSFFCATSEAFMHTLYTSSALMWGLIIAELALVFIISGAINKLSTGAAVALLLLFSVINGMMLSSIFLAYTMSSITKTFFITAGTFGAMSIYGYTTNQDLSKIGNILIMALIGLVIASLVNIFLHSSTLDWIVSIAGVVIFVGMTAYDTQAIRRMAAYIPAEHMGKLAVIGALNLYLDFINLFLYLLRFFGSSRD